MKALTTTYHGATETKGSRLTATEPDGRRVTVAYDYALGSEGNHRAAALALSAKLGWGDSFESGYLGRAQYAHVYTKWEGCPCQG